MRSHQQCAIVSIVKDGVDELPLGDGIDSSEGVLEDYKLGATNEGHTQGETPRLAMGEVFCFPFLEAFQFTGIDHVIYLLLFCHLRYSCKASKEQ